MKAKQARISSSRLDDGYAFLPEPTTGMRSTRAADAGFFGEEFVASALTGESCNEEVRDEVLEDEEGGFHVVGEDDLAPITSGGSTLDLDIDPVESKSETLAHEQVLRGGRWAARGA